MDEATQILEPQLLGILCAKFADERKAVGKFILIGDHKQLPAVILQNSGHSEVHDEGLREAGLFNLKSSALAAIEATVPTYTLQSAIRIFTSLLPVSYTHLDVYKRQDRNSIIHESPSTFHSLLQSTEIPRSIA